MTVACSLRRGLGRVLLQRLASQQPRRRRSALGQVLLQPPQASQQPPQ